MKSGRFVAKADILAFIEAIMRVYNESGRRDNIHKARIKILVHQIGPKRCASASSASSPKSEQSGTLQLPEAEMQRIAAYFAPPAFEELAGHVARARSRRRRPIPRSRIG